MIRRAEMLDLPYFLRTAQEFVEHTPFSLDPESYLIQVADMIHRKDMAIFTTGEGHCAVALMPSMYDTNQIVAKVVSTGGTGGLKCFRKAAKWAQGEGASILIADSYLEPRMDKFYERFGMIQTDSVFIKVI